LIFCREFWLREEDIGATFVANPTSDNLKKRKQEDFSTRRPA